MRLAALLIPDAAAMGVIGGVVCSLAIIVWWLVFSRAAWLDRVGAIVLMIVAILATSRVVHESISNGMMGMMLPIMGIPILSVALVVWAAASRNLSSGLRRASMVVVILLASVPMVVIRTAGIIGGASSELHWRWTKTPEQRLLEQASDEPQPPAAAPAPVANSDKTIAREADKPAPPAVAAAPPPSGPASAAPSATASFAACRSRPTGRRSRRSRCGAVRSARGGRPSRSAATFFIPRSSEATMRSWPATR
jgi:hypothetical protein